MQPYHNVCITFVEFTAYKSFEKWKSTEIYIEARVLSCSVGAAEWWLNSYRGAEAWQSVNRGQYWVTLNSWSTPVLLSLGAYSPVLLPRVINYSFSINALTRASGEGVWKHTRTCTLHWEWQSCSKSLCRPKCTRGQKRGHYSKPPKQKYREWLGTTSMLWRGPGDKRPHIFQTGFPW